MRHPDPDATLSAPSMRRKLLGETCVGLTIVWHPERARIGEQAAVIAPDGADWELNRFTPIFRAMAARAPGQALAHRAISRQSLVLRAHDDGGVDLRVPDSAMRVLVDGEVARDEQHLDAARISQGVVLQLGERVVLMLGRIAALPPAGHDLGLIGVSSAIESVRAQIRQVARTDLSVLLLGESGSGKELVAQALHKLSARHAGPLVSINMAAMSDELAAAELFGALKGAYTGAQHARRGLLAEAFGGTLFMDEIGDTPATIQPMLLRALETGEYRPLGANRVERADARFIAATDRDLAAGHFNQPLLRRLEAFVIRLPPLRARREDVGVLTRHFLALAVGEGAPSVELEAADVARLARFDWPGNVRQLAHVVRRLALARQNDASAPLDDILDTLTQAAAVTSSARARETLAPTREERASPRDGAPESPARRYRDPNTIDDDALFDALAATAWCVRDAAQRLNISRTSCYALLARSRRVRRIDEIATDEIRATMRAHPGDPDRWAATLHTPLEALKRRIRSIEREL